MKNITLKKISFEDLLVLQNSTLQFRNQKTELLQTTNYNDAYFNDLLSADLASNLYYRFRHKIENENKESTNFKLKISEAIILLQCCNDYITSHKEVKITVYNYLSELHKQLINI